MAKYNKTFVDGQPLTAAELNGVLGAANGAAGAVGNATTTAELASVVAQGIKNNADAQKNVTFGAGTASELASVVVGLAPVVTMLGADDGVYINTSGGNGTYQYCTTSKFIKINAGQKLIAYTVCHTDSLAIALYNDSKGYISGVRGVNMNGIRRYEATATVNGYFRFATNSQHIDYAKSASICYVVG